MKKILILLVATLIIFTGCENIRNTPTSRVEEFLGRYQKLDSDVLSELENVIDSDNSMNSEQQAEYKTLLEKQYQNLSYKITDEDIKGTKATVTAEIEVYDYETSIINSKKYYLENQDEFKNKKDDNEEDSKEGLDEITDYIDYKIQELKKVTARKKYDIVFELSKEDGMWQINDLSETDLKKIHGLY